MKFDDLLCCPACASMFRPIRDEEICPKCAKKEAETLAALNHEAQDESDSVH